MDKKKDPVLIELNVKFVCSSCEETVSTSFDPSDIEVSSDNCELCGSHGSSELYTCCPACKAYQTIVLRAW